MNIFIDESGSFVSAAKRDSWNCVAAYLSPEVDRRYLRSTLARLKGGAGMSTNVEVKLRGIREDCYFDFLRELDGLGGVLFVVATDAGLNSVPELVAHRDGQAEKIVEHKDKMIYDAGRRGLEELAAKFRALSPQLYVQLHCQVALLEDILLNGILYFVQRTPVTLGHLRWRIDQKNASLTEYERAFTSVVAPWLQSKSLRRPMPKLIGADYRYFARYDYAEGEEPTYLKDTYGIEIEHKGPVLNLGKLIREDLKFEDSKKNLGVQVADLLAAGVRRCLRRQFKDNDTAAALLGALMVQAAERQPPVRLLAFTLSGEEERILVGNELARVARIMRSTVRHMLDATFARQGT